MRTSPLTLSSCIRRLIYTRSSVRAASLDSQNVPSAEAHTLVASSTQPSSPLVQRRATFDTSEAPRQSRTPDNSKRASTLPNLTRISSRMSVMRRRLSEQLEPARPVGTPPGTWQGIRAILTTSCTRKGAFRRETS